MSQAEIGIIGGSGLYQMKGLTDIREVTLETPFGKPSDAYVLGTLSGRKVAFLAGLVLSPGGVATRRRRASPTRARTSRSRCCSRSSRFSAPAGVLGNNVLSDPCSLSVWIYADLAFFLPPAILTGVWLLKKKPLAFTVAPAMLVFLILTGIKMVVKREEEIHPERNPVVKWFKKLMPVTAAYREDRFFVKEGGRRWATPLFVVLLLVEFSDLIFAVDSIPAIFAVTTDPFIVYTSNVFAILGLRAMYFMLAGAVETFHLLKYGLSVVLIFVGLKMVWLNPWYGGKFPITYSLGFIGAVLVASLLLSLLFPKRPGRSGSGSPTSKETK